MHRIFALVALTLSGLFAASIFVVPFVEAGGGFGGCTSRPREGVSEPIFIKDSCYSPAVLYVEPKETVTWTNEDPFAHNVTLFNGQLLSDHVSMPPNESISYSFESKGVYPY
jgi:hypothetical protein